MDEFLQALKTLAKDCQFKDATATVYRDEAVRDAFITGLQSTSIRQRLLENSTLDLKTMFTQARSLDVAQKSSETYVTSSPHSFPTAATTSSPLPAGNPENDSESTIAAVTGAKCYFCSYGNVQLRMPLAKVVKRRDTLPRFVGLIPLVADTSKVVLQLLCIQH